MNADGVRARGLEEDLWTKHAYAPAVVLPAPAADATAGTVFKIDLSSRSRAGAKHRRAAAVDAVGKLYPHGVVAPIVVLRFGTDPQTIRPARFGGEGHVEVVCRVCGSRS